MNLILSFDLAQWKGKNHLDLMIEILGSAKDLKQEYVHMKFGPRESTNHFMMAKIIHDLYRSMPRNAMMLVHRSGWEIILTGPEIYHSNPDFVRM